MNNHRSIDSRSRAFGQAIAEQLRKRPDLLNVAKRNIAVWEKTCSLAVRTTLSEWQEILDAPTDEVFKILCEDSEHAIRLRQSNPFAGVLTEQERLEILTRFESRAMADSQSSATYFER